MKRGYIVLAMLSAATMACLAVIAAQWPGQFTEESWMKTNRLDAPKKSDRLQENVLQISAVG